MDREFLVDLFAGFGPVTIRRMFSGFGISADGINFALALRSGLYLRADETSFDKFEAAGSKPFSYETRARSMTVRSYWQVPAHLYDDTDEFALWAKEAFAAAQRAALAKQTRKKRAVPRSEGAVKEAGLQSNRTKSSKAESSKAKSGKAKSSGTKKAVSKAKAAKTRKAAKSPTKTSATGRKAASGRTTRSASSRTR
ncbi:TfoX/Sxy family protein [Bradyrhizobium sp. HKCCYLR20261]|uniref:TfoX/Sxy family protein n=1 Tax=Bradyrhizobium sp. HKCCYLR20261 TaxID=3420760 RepID=UPI003EB7FC3F